MINEQLHTNYNESLLLKSFNDRDDYAYNQVYLALYDELYYFTNKMFNGENLTIDDIIHDVFLALLENKSRKFESLDAIKAYIYVSIKNRFLKHIRHKKSIDKHIEYAQREEEHFFVNVAENEIISIIAKSADLMPAQCAEVFRLCLKGMDIKDIAAELNKTESAVYKQRAEAIRIVKKRFPKNELLFVLFLMQ